MRSRSRRLFAACAVVFALAPLSAGQSGKPTSTTPAQTRASDLDAFMARVLERRDEAWKKLHDYVLNETERFEITGPGRVRLNGMRRDFAWYVRDGFLVRSPLRFDGVTITEDERRKYEDKWLSEEKARQERRDKGAQAAAQAAHGEAGGEPAPPAAAGGRGQADDARVVEGFVDRRGEPRFISEAFFLKFKFEAGNYYLVGRERLEGRDVVRIEYYPTRLFSDDDEQKQADRDRPQRDSAEQKKDADLERRIEHGLNKVALVTLWIDPAEYQVVKYKFDNVDFGFLPGRWLVRVDDVTASMTMGRVLDGVWLPRDVSAQAAVTLASGSYGFQYGREFYDYKKAETSARITGVR